MFKKYPNHAEHIMQMMGYPPKWKRQMQAPLACLSAVIIGAFLAEIVWTIQNIEVFV